MSIRGNLVATRISEAEAAFSGIGKRLRGICAETQPNEIRLRAVVDDAYIEILARAVAGGLGGKVGVAPRLFLKKLVVDVLDRVDLHERLR